MTIDFQYIAYALIAVIFGWITRDLKQIDKEVKRVEKERKEVTDAHEKRIQKVEDLHGRDIDEIKRLLAELSIEVKALNKYVHRENHDLLDLINQQKDIIQLMHKHMEDLIKK